MTTSMKENTLKQPEKVKVSIVSISYNQEKYIAQALESFVKQRTNFMFEIIIADDGSTDRTPDIISGYAEKFPDLFKPILRKKNIGIQPNLVDAMQKATGQYVALCEGDDYWTDPLKLQKQVDFLDKKPEYSLCFHLVKVFYENKENGTSIYPDPDNLPTLTTESLLQRNFIQTNSVMYRRKSYDHTPLDILPLDWYLHLYHAMSGKIGLIKDVMSAYRRHSGGVWWNPNENADGIWLRHGVAHLRLYEEFLKLLGNNSKYASIVHEYMYTGIKNILGAESRIGDMSTMKQVMTRFPEAYLTFLKSFYEESLDTEQHLLGDIEKISHDNDLLRTHINNLEHSLKLIRSSIVWRVRTKLARVIGRQ